jgi:two-component system sensor histidine kinase DegS
MAKPAAETPSSSPDTPADLAARLAGDLVAVDQELSEIDLLVTQATAEASRHEGRRAQAAEKATKAASGGGDPRQLVELYDQLMTLTKRAALMESQVEVLEGKRRVLVRYRDALTAYAAAAETQSAAGTSAGAQAVELAGMPPAVSRLLLTAQEDLRREISRAMHDGPAQSLTNIVLQAQIVERLVTADPVGARGEVRQLVAMVQQTLEATKSFIFDVRPMVLDDLGLVPTLRRAARDRGRRAGIPVEFDSLGTDRRLSMELESGLFRIIDEALTAYLSAGPDRVSVKLDWAERFEARVTATRGTGDGATDGSSASAAHAEPSRKKGEELPPALAAMIEDRRADEREAAEAARLGAIVTLPAATWREIETRAATLGIEAELVEEGGELRIAVDLPALEALAPA